MDKKLIFRPPHTTRFGPSSASQLTTSEPQLASLSPVRPDIICPGRPVCQSLFLPVR